MQRLPPRRCWRCRRAPCRRAAQRTCSDINPTGHVHSGGHRVPEQHAGECVSATAFQCFFLLVGVCVPCVFLSSCGSAGRRRFSPSAVNGVYYRLGMRFRWTTNKAHSWVGTYPAGCSLRTGIFFPSSACRVVCVERLLLTQCDPVCVLPFLHTRARRGSFGTVFKARHRLTGDVVAVKVRLTDDEGCGSRNCEGGKSGVVGLTRPWSGPRVGA